MALDNVFGDLRDSNRFEDYTMLHADELLIERIQNENLARDCFYTADGQGYFLGREDEVELQITRFNKNILLQHMHDGDVEVFDQLKKRGFYSCSDFEDLAQFNDDSYTAVVQLDAVRFAMGRGKFSHLEVRCADGNILSKELPDGVYVTSNAEERKLLAAFGYTQRILGKMKREFGINYTSISVLNPDWARNEMMSNSTGSLWAGTAINNQRNKFALTAVGIDVAQKCMMRGKLRPAESVKLSEMR
ncbi:hypothetical protein HOA92_06275 [archaeon]|jgi:hypothetical protein|nr:hypothetical protein [archaeon]MBT6762617.1 hypothetical protein [archaeon]